MEEEGTESRHTDLIAACSATVLEMSPASTAAAYLVPVRGQRDRPAAQGRRDGADTEAGQ